MKGAKCIRAEGVPPRWEWEKSGTISVCGLGGTKDSEKDVVVETINNMIKEFRLPLKAERCSPADEEEIRDIIAKYPRAGTVDDDEVLKFLYEIRRDSQKFPQAIIIILDQDKYKPLHCWEEYPGIYGVGHDDGLVFLRFTREAVVRHEVGHMFGLSHHAKNDNPTCIMHWECPSTQFCDACKNELEDIWEEELKGKH